MINETREYVKFENLDARAKVNCVDQFVNIICAYEDFEGESLDDIGQDAEWFVEADPMQYWFDANGDWYDEGKMVR